MSTLAQVGLAIDFSGLAAGLVLLLGYLVFVPMVLLSIRWAWRCRVLHDSSSTPAWGALTLACIYIIISLTLAPEPQGPIRMVMMAIAALLSVIALVALCRNSIASSRSVRSSGTRPVVEFSGPSVCRVRSGEQCISIAFDYTSTGYLIYSSSATHEGAADQGRPVNADELAASLNSIRRHCSDIGFTVDMQ